MTKTAVVHSRQRWEYQSVTRRTEVTLEKDLNELGQEGWELVSIDHGKDMKGNVTWTAFMKRPAAPQPPGASPDVQARETAPQRAEEPEPADAPAGSEGFDLSGDEFGIKEEEEEEEE